MSTIPAALLALALADLPRPPAQVTFPARIGEVTFRHDRHLERREPCRGCHGAGPVGPIERGKDRLHALCAGCHQEKGGPTACSSCHAIQRRSDG
jgi:mono/diheme cytochrome c family protein